MNPKKAPLAGIKSNILPWDARYWMHIGIFSAMALVPILPTGAGGGLIFLLCSIIYLTRRHHGQSNVRLIPKYEILFLGSMFLYPSVMVLNCLLFTDPINARYFDNPSRFLLALPIYWAIRKSQIMPTSLIMGAIIGATGCGILAIYQWTTGGMGDIRAYGLTNAISFADITLLLVCIASVPVSLSKVWTWLRICGMGLGITAVFLAQTLGAWIAVPVLIWLMTEWFFNDRHEFKKRCALTAVIVVGLLLVVPQTKLTSAVTEMLHYWKNPSKTESVVYSASVRCRLELWRAGWILFSDHPWSGIGFGNYKSRVDQLEEEGRISAIPCIRASYASMKHAHSDFVHLGATMGVPGILAYLLPLTFLYSIGYHCCRQHDYTMGVTLKIFAVGQGIFSLTQSQLHHNISTSFFALTAMSLVALSFNHLKGSDNMIPSAR